MQSVKLGLTYDNFINGAWTPSSTGLTEASINPACRDEAVGYIPLSSERDLESAVESAKRALPLWKRTAAPTRGDILFKVAAVMERRLEEIAETMTREMGKTYPEAKGETARGIAILRYYAGEGMRKVGDVIPSTDGEAMMFTTRSPLGVVGVITPWNFPVAIPLWKIAPALIYGNTVVFKPAQEASVTAAKIVECFEEAGMPAGVINFICGRGSVIGQGIAEHPDINGITFTGSNAVGKMIGQAALRRGAKYQLEMGGKNPIIVSHDADLDAAAEAAVSGGLKSTGQKCTATSRVLVHQSVYDEFKRILLDKVSRITVGDGMSGGVWMGPCASEAQMETVLDYIRIGIEEGARLLAGGKRLQEGGLENGYFVEPTVFDGVASHMRIAQEEIFGPVLALIPFDGFEQAIEMANDTEFGLSASIFTSNIGNVLGFIRDVDAGLIRINSETAGVELQAPFGGMKQSSSHSREQGQAAIEFFTSIKTVFIRP